MNITKKQIIILLIVIIVGAILGRLSVRAIMNLMLGGTMFGGDLLWKKKRRKEKECLYLYVY